MSGVTDPLSQQIGDRQPAPSNPDQPPSPLGVPWVTYAIITVCAAIFAYLNLATGMPSYKRIVATLVPSCVAIWSGAYWGLITSAFVHYALWHILFNMWWTKDFGRVLELSMGRGRYLLFVVAAAVVSSGAQLASSATTGIGFSGVVYAMFGYGLVARRVEPRLAKVATAQTTALFLGWFVLCVVLSVTNVWQVGNAAHLAGFLFGCLTGCALAARVYVKASVSGLAVLSGIAILSVTYMPWSPYWKDRGYWSEYMDSPQKARQGDPKAQFLYSQMLVQEKGKKKESMSWLRKSADQGYLPALNELAWALATDADDSFRNGVEAVNWAERLCKEDGWKTAMYVDTLAAAYAEQGRWDDAVATQKKAIDALTPADASIKTSVVSRLQTYLSRQKVRE